MGTAAKILQEIPEDTDNKTKGKILFECKQGITRFNPRDDLDRSLKNRIVGIIEKLESFQEEPEQ